MQEVLLNATVSKDKSRSQKKIVRLGAKMNVSDLQNKVRQAKDLAEKSETIKIQMVVSDLTSEAGRNIMMTVPEQFQGFA